MKKTALSSRIRQLRTDAGLTQRKLAEQLGKSESAIRMWELGKNEPDCYSLLTLSNIFGCSVDYLLGNDLNNTGYGISYSNICVYASYSLNTTPKDAIDYLSLPGKYMNDGNHYFAVMVSDLSMMPFLEKGDLVLIRKQDTCFASQLALVSAGKEKALLRKVLFQNAGILFQPFNPAFDSLFVSSQSISELPVNILGVIVQIIREF